MFVCVCVPCLEGQHMNILVFMCLYILAYQDMTIFSCFQLCVIWVTISTTTISCLKEKLPYQPLMIKKRCSLHMWVFVKCKGSLGYRIMIWYNTTDGCKRYWEQDLDEYDTRELKINVKFTSEKWHFREQNHISAFSLIPFCHHAAWLKRKLISETLPLKS